MISYIGDFSYDVCSYPFCAMDTGWVRSYYNIFIRLDDLVYWFVPTYVCFDICLQFVGIGKVSLPDIHPV